MRRYEKIEQDVARLLSDQEVANYCLGIVRYVISHDEQLSRHLTYRHLGMILEVDPASDALQAAISVLCSRFKALQLHMEFFDDQGKVFNLNDDELAYFFQTGQLTHPYTGQNVPEPSEHLVPYLSASKSELLSDN